MSSCVKSTRFLYFMLFIIFLNSNHLSTVCASRVTIAVSICELRGENRSYLRENFELHDFSRQYNQVIALLKSLLISWDTRDPTSFLDFIVFSNSAEAKHEIQRLVETWLPENTAFLNLTFRNAAYPAGKIPN